MKICVTGGAGFIGSHLVDTLIELGHEVWVIDDFSTGLKANVNKKAKLLNTNLLSNNNFCLSIYQGWEQIYHLAATVGYYKVLNNPVRCYYDNVKMVDIVFNKLCKGEPIKKVLLTSSSEVYGYTSNSRLKETNECGPFESPQNGKDAYAISKWVSELYVSNSNINSVIARLFNTSGARQLPDYGMVLPSFVQRSLQDKPHIITGNGEQKRCFCHVTDTVNALIGLMNSNKTEKGEAFNVGNPINEISINSLSKRVAQLCGVEHKVEYINYDKAYNHNNFKDVFVRRPDTRKLWDKTGHVAYRSINHIIKDNIEWQKKYYMT